MSEKGSLFVITLGIIIVLSIMLYSISFNTGMRAREILIAADRLQARLNAETGLKLMMARIQNGKLQELPAEINSHLYDSEENSYSALITKGTLEAKTKEDIPGQSTASGFELDSRLTFKPDDSARSYIIRVKGRFRNREYPMIAVVNNNNPLFMICGNSAILRN